MRFTYQNRQYNPSNIVSLTVLLAWFRLKDWWQS
jgi:hypothetical protein